MLDTITTMFKLTWRHSRRLWNVYAFCVSQGITEALFKRDWWFWYHCVPDLLEYTYTKNYQNRALFDKVIAKI